MSLSPTSSVSSSNSAFFKHPSITSHVQRQPEQNAIEGGVAAAYKRPPTLKIPSSSGQNEEHLHWLENVSTFRTAANTPVIQRLQHIASGMITPKANPTIQSVRSCEERDFRGSSVRSPQILTLRERVERFRSAPSTPLVSSVRSMENNLHNAPAAAPVIVEDRFRSAPASPLLLSVRAMSEDPFSCTAACLGESGSYDSCAANPLAAGLQQNALQVEAFRVDLTGFRSESVNSQLIAIREEMEGFSGGPESSEQQVCSLQGRSGSSSQQLSDKLVAAHLSATLEDPFGVGFDPYGPA
ncbi:hypothetical protein CEUSTIGMA_g4366.t1 [Chlamydomonas eustigma]|uniref:Uncharacterized protein n=1 Tax=Chlamydomonas eustigma TaxID=1157962 RepID=A0A250X2E9_9CHLO|nr:hypothetical protein CEUSTIGMA_g4366.t1 [Chlamydomonas eustigma]|eukprot:GAX76920.1 hypothetical protein CEUSTIGMA_g4366.t1 [Chlamydomonas eustigma]